MESNKLVFVLIVLSIAALIPCLEAIPDLFSKDNPLVSSFESLNVTSILDFNLTSRRELKRKYKGPCTAVNPIDKCWRCQADWANHRERLADCAMGFGYKTTGGKGGPIYVVTDHSDDDIRDPKPGTLRHAVIQDGPLWIIFARSMVIKLQQELIMTSNKTIDGRGHNVRIAYGAGITVQFIKNVIIHNLHIHDIVPRPGGLIRDSVKHIGIRTASDGDAISIFGSTNIWVDHISGWRCADGLVDVVAGSTDVTISNCHFTKHNEVMLFGASDIDIRDDDMRVTVAFNHFGKGLVQRMPRCRRGFVHVVNNDYTHWQMYAIGGTAHPTILSQGNRFIAHNNAVTKEVTKRTPVPQFIWKNWDWQTEDDLLLNGAIFVPSGSKINHKYSDKQIIKHYPGKMTAQLTMFAGTLPCRVGKAC